MAGDKSDTDVKLSIPQEMSDDQVLNEVRKVLEDHFNAQKSQAGPSTIFRDIVLKKSKT